MHISVNPWQHTEQHLDEWLLSNFPGKALASFSQCKTFSDQIVLPLPWRWTHKPKACVSHFIFSRKDVTNIIKCAKTFLFQDQVTFLIYFSKYIYCVKFFFLYHTLLVWIEIRQIVVSVVTWLMQAMILYPTLKY